MDSSVSEFFKFCRERHAIYLRRKTGQPWPWTEDEVLKNYRFTNIYRELDRVTIWIRKNWREPFVDHPNLAFAMCVARFINRIETLEEIGFPKTWDARKIADQLNARMKRGEGVYNPAYMIRAENKPGRVGYDDKQYYLTKVVLEPIWEIRTAFEDFGTLQEATEWLTEFYGWGPFMAYEVITDLRHTRYLKDAPDIMTWANAGPGAKRGLNRVFRGNVKDGKGADYLLEMRNLLSFSRESGYWPKNLHYPRLEMRDIEHSLCEFDKYCRAKTGEGRPKQVYRKPAHDLV